MKRIEPSLADPYQKDAAAESFLEELNEHLAPFETYPPLPERYPTLHIVGSPRSGTTVLSQLVARHLDVGYIDHLTAAFWRAPVTGARLSRKVLGDVRPTSLTSEFGRTSRVEDPHEFGYFWRSVLASPELRVIDPAESDRIEWERLGRILTHMTHAHGRPVVFKSFQLASLMAPMQRVLPKTCFVWVRRDPVNTARSILKLRSTFLGDRSQWASIKPLDHDALIERPVWEQVVGQVLSVERSIALAAQAVGGHNVLEVPYEELCAAPEAWLARVRELLADNGVDVTWRDGAPPAPLEYRSAPDDVDTERIRAALAALAPTYSSP